MTKTSPPTGSTLPAPTRLERLDDDMAARERLVRDGFWPKARRVLARLPFAEDLVAAWFCARDPRTPAYARAVLIGALAYFVMPMDLIPDMMAGLGFTDDASVLLAALSTIGGHIKPRHRRQAREILDLAPIDDENEDAFDDPDTGRRAR